MRRVMEWFGWEGRLELVMFRPPGLSISGVWEDLDELCGGVWTLRVDCSSQNTHTGYKDIYI